MHGVVSGSHTIGIRGHRAAVSARIEDGLRNRSLTQRPGAVSAIHSGLLMSTRSREGAVGRRTRRSTYRQEIADTNRSAVAKAIERYLGISTVTAASISLPAFPTGVDPVRLQRVISAMVRFGLLPPGLAFYPITAMLGS
jgi:hypothetical protein